MSIYDSSNSLLVSPTIKNGISTLINLFGKQKECDAFYSWAISDAIGKNETYIYKCPTNFFIFVIPIIINEDNTIVIVGGWFYLSKDDLNDAFEKETSLGVERERFEEFKKDVKIISQANEIFVLPDLVKSLVVPFLQSLYKKGTTKTEAQLENMYQSISPVVGSENLYDTILNKSVEIVGAEQGSLMLLNKNCDDLIVKAVKGEYAKEFEGRSIKVGEGIAGSIVKWGVPMVIKDIETELPLRKNRSNYKTKSFIGIPLKFGSQTVGVINISDKITGEVFSEDDLKLLASVSSYASIVLEREAYYKKSEELKTLSITDSLTGIHNRRWFQERLSEEVERAKRYEECFSLIMLDLDDFKVINDSYGHLVGDACLKGVADVLRKVVRYMDMPSRFGGEEFCVILPCTKKNEALIIAQRIRKEIEEFKFNDKNFYPKEGMTASIGLAEFPTDAETEEELIEKADKALYLAKSRGKNKVVLVGE